MQAAAEPLAILGVPGYTLLNQPFCNWQRPGRKREVEQFLIDAEPLARQEPTTTAWFAIHLDNGEFGIFDAFPDSGGRFAHLAGHLPRELAKHALTLLGSMPELEMLDVIADKVITQ